jgi:hypothetical protein
VKRIHLNTYKHYEITFKLFSNERDKKKEIQEHKIPEANCDSTVIPSYNYRGLDWPLGLQEVKAPRLFYIVCT